MYSIGIDLGGTSIKAGIVDEKGNILAKASCPTGVERGQDAVVYDMARLAKKLIDESPYDISDFRAIGIGVPGIQDPRTGRVPFSTNLFWHDVPVIDLMHEIIDLPIYIDNDATVAGVAESVAGVSAGIENSVFLTLGTGVGAGIIIHGKPYSGSHGVGSELGHMIIMCENGVPCTCGNVGCIDRYCSATALIRDGREAMAKNPDCALAKRVNGDPEKVTAKDVIDLAKEGEPVCSQIFDHYIFYLCVVIVSIINSFDPEVIALGGGVSHAGQFLLDAIAKKLPDMIFYKTMPYARIELATLGNDAGIIGAAMLGR